MFIDTHCHLSLDDYKNIDDILLENRKEKVSPIIISGCTKKDISEALMYGKKYSDVYVVLGYHPSEVSMVI